MVEREMIARRDGVTSQVLYPPLKQFLLILIRRAKSLVCTLFSGKLPHIPYLSTYLLKRFAFF
jgi:hypothetical protein